MLGTSADLTVNMATCYYQITVTEAIPCALIHTSSQLKMMLLNRVSRPRNWFQNMFARMIWWLLLSPLVSSF